MARVVTIRRAGRSLEEQLANRFLLLCTLKDLNECDARVYATALQKLVFLAGRETLTSRIKGFNYNFIRLDFGPCFSELKRDFSFNRARNACHYSTVSLIEPEKFLRPREGLF